ncbi:MAG: zinc-finger domain-containing protein [Proteobacteria bacterium]|nr:zinc-finger domain-containing protein [Pseudomonadota bacterium]MBI3498450.1 zinc-finger domain-containing protein [Pseudomonadota bacterium]
MPAAEVILVEERVFSCDGGDGPLGHPRVFLNLGDKGEIDCPYCGRRYALKAGAAAHAGAH